MKHLLEAIADMKSNNKYVNKKSIYYIQLNNQ